MSKAKLPAKQFSQFIEAAAKWLQKTADNKISGLDVSLEIIDSVATMSVGGDSSFIKVSFDATEKLEENFEQVFLDLSYLVQLPLEPEGEITLVKQKPKPGKEESADKRLAISYKGMNFKVPLKAGDTWKKNKHDFNEHEVTTYVEFQNREVFNTIYRDSILPASFGVKQQQIICFHKKQNLEGVFVYTEDGFGAFCHQFKNDSISFSEGANMIPVLYDFFIPLIKILDLESLKVYSSDRYILGSLKSSLFKTFHWIQPKLQRGMDDIQEIMETIRKSNKANVSLDVKEFLKSVKNALVFFKPNNMKDTPLQFLVLNNKYSVSASLPTTFSQVEGSTLSVHETPVRIFFHAASLRDYLDMLDTSRSCIMEVYSNQVLIFQETEEAKLCYLLPIISSGGVG